MIQLEDFDKVEMRAVTGVKENKKARNPANVVTADFGEELGVKSRPPKLPRYISQRISSGSRSSAA